MYNNQLYGDNLMGEISGMAEENAAIDHFDAPTTPGPWGLTANGTWFKVTRVSPGSQVINVDGRQIYSPAEHPSVRVKENQYNAGETHLKRWTDRKFRAANAAALQNNAFEKLFFNVAPRGGLLSAGRAFQSEGAGYDSEGGHIYPGLTPADPEATVLNDWWRRQTMDNRWGYDRGLTLNWLRVYTDPISGYRKYKAWTNAEFQDFSERWWLADHGFTCPPDEIVSLTNLAISKQRERQGAQTEGQYSAHWPWIIGPLSQCSRSSRSRLQDSLRKAAVVAGVVVGAVFLGPMVGTALKTAGGAISGAIGGTAGTVASIGSAAAAIIPKVVSGVNTAATVKAIANGEVPPPPINLEGDNFTDWAMSIATDQIEKDLARKLNDQEQAMLRAEVQEQQRQGNLLLQQSPQPVYMQPYQQVPAPVQMVMAGEAQKDDTMKTMLMMGIPIAAMLIMRG